MKPTAPDPLTMESLFGALFDPAVWADPYDLYAVVREQGAVQRVDAHMWLATTHEAVQAISRHPACSTNERNATVFDHEADEDVYLSGIGDLLLFIDPPDHTRLRKLVVRAFTPRQVALMEPRAGEIVDRLLAAVSDRSDFDVVAEFGHPLAVQMICELLGVPFEDRDRFSAWGTAVARVIDPEVLRSPQQEAAATEASSELRGYFNDLIIRRRSAPADDLLSALIAAEEDGDRLTLDELIAVCLILLVAGYETTVNLVANGTVSLLQNRSEWARLCADPSLSSTAVEEMLRYDSPAQMTIRIATADIEVAGQTIPSGDQIVNLIGAANRDPLVFVEPDRFDIGRSVNPHLSFGGGIHHCLGAALARTEARVAFTGLVERFPQLQLAQEPERRPTFTLRGFSKLLVATGDQRPPEQLRSTPVQYDDFSDASHMIDSATSSG